jgi:uncharacterized membrane protein/SH3-like domain-containing protein
MSGITTLTGVFIMFILSIFLRKMIHLKKTWLPLTACFCLSCLSPAASSQTIWQGKSDGYNIHWTQKDITATKGGKVVFSAEKALARKYFEREYLDYANEEPGFVGYERILTLLSVVGTIASMKDTFEEGRRVLIYGDSKITTVNLANPDKVVSLTDFFGESVILEALLADPFIQKALAEIDSTTPPSTLDAFYQVLDKAPNIVVRMEYGEDCYFRLSEDFLTQFAFHHINKDRVAVRIALSPTTLGCHTEQAQLGIYLPTPNKLKLALKKAQKGQAGFLMKNLKKMAKEQQTTLYFSTDTYIPYPVAGTRVTTLSNARLRTLPQVTRSEIVATLKKGTVLKTLARTSFQEDSRRYHGDYWYLVKLENGKIGWIFGALTKILEKAPLTSPRKTTNNGVRVRSAPNLFARIVETLDKGVIVYAFARSKRQDKIGDTLDYWYQVNLERDKTGWIFGGLLMETETRVLMGEKIHARSAPEQQSNVVETFDYQHTHLDIYGRSKHQDKIGGILDYWYQVGESRNRHQGEVGPTGWVFGGQIMRIGTKITTTSRVSMRSAPNLNARRISRLKKGVVVNAITRSTHQNKIAGNLDYWYKVKSMDGKIGWVFGGLLMSIGFSEMPLYTISETTVQERDEDEMAETTVQEKDEMAETLPEKNLDCGGVEPSWNMKISTEGIQYGDIKEQSMKFPVFSLKISSNATNVWSIKASEKANKKSVVLFLQKNKCTDGMSDNEYNYSIFVRLHDDSVLSGCCN